jgi:hypothetical protein
VTNDNGGTLGVADFPLFVDTTSVTSGEKNGFDAGTYTASETEQYGYAASDWGGDCAANGNVTLNVGDDKTCTITNNDIQPKLTVTKVVQNWYGGTATVADFDLFVDATSVTSGQQNGFNAGDYVVSEGTLPSGYEQISITGDCDGSGNVSLAVGDVKACTITNRDIQPKLTVIKHVINNSGGRLVASDFEITVTGSATGGSTSFPGAESPGTTLMLVAGTFDVTETDAYAQFYAATYSGDCTGTLNVGDDKTCTITNDDIRQQNQASIQIERLEYSITDTNSNGRGDQIQGSFDISNQSEMPLVILIDEFDFTVEVRQGKKWVPIDGSCTTDPAAPYVWDAGLPDLLTVDFQCTGLDPEIKSGTEVRVTANVYIFGRRKAFSYKSTLIY